MELQGYVVVALTLILLGYLLPHLVRSRQVLLDSRVDDRFSGDLRILSTGAAGQAVHSWGHTDGARPYLHATTARRPEATMTPPRARGERVDDDARALAAARAARAARLSRRAAATRRRLVLTTALLLITAAAWTAVELAGLHWAAAAAPSALLVTVLVLGRRAAVQARVNDQRDRAEMARAAARLEAVSGRGRAARTGPVAKVPAPAGPPRVQRRRYATQVPAEQSAASSAESPAEASAGSTADSSEKADIKIDVGPDATEPDGEPQEGAEDAEHDEAQPAAAEEPRLPEGPPSPGGDDGGTPGSTRPRAWTPVPVPVPSYTLKPHAPRRQVAPYTVEEAPSAAVPQRPSAASATADGPPPAAEPPPPPLDLDAVLARRRAAGA
ncbi:hypothetical protein GCM10023169_14050 [Georgenia halophila]|uniref:Uncharacterized protein n=1 Tax=Georgenia halophila TaxID=620889 RepID=A0ABP8L3A9_9MICO